MVPVDGGLIAGWRWSNPGARRLLFAHANGFCASAYKQMLSQLAGEFDIYAIDLRGHGRTTLPADPAALRDWNVYARDIAALLDHRDLRGAPWILAGHSCGAVSVMLAAVGRNDVSSLALIEPVAPPPHLALFARTPLWPIVARRSSLAKGAKARRRVWAERSAVHESYARKSLFKAWAAGVLDDYLEDGLIERDGAVALACNPDWEAASFMAQAHDFWRAVAHSPGPVSVLGADHAGSTLFGGAASRFKRLNAALRLHKGAGHLLPLEAPEIAAAFVREAAPIL